MRDWIRGLSPRAEFLVVWTVCFGLFTAVAVVSLIGGFPQGDVNARRAAEGIAIELVLLAAFTFVMRNRGWTPRRLGLRFSWRAALAGIPLYAVFVVLWTVVWYVVASFGTLPSYAVSMTAPAWLAVAFIILNSVYEELTVSGYVIGALADGGAAYAITASTLIRFAYHLYQGPVAAMAILPFGLLFGAVYWRWRTLTPLIVAHTLTNLISLLGSR